MNNEATYPLSINPNISGKPAKSDKVDLARGFRSIDATPDEIFEHISRGYAIAPQYSGGHRKTSNFIQSGFLAADIDGGLTLEEAQQHPFVLRNASFIHTTASHTDQHHRLRIVFLLDEPITKAADYAAAQFGLAITLECDRA